MSNGNFGNGKSLEKGEGKVLCALKEVHPQLDKSSPDSKSLPQSESTEHCFLEYNDGSEALSGLQQ
jgi:hypothetical protein